MNSKIVIVGSGASGIAAGAKLLEYGFKNIVVLEALNRIGGRIATESFGSHVVDLGAQWCHGEKDNVVFEMVNQHQPFEPTTRLLSAFSFMRSDGNSLDIAQCEQVMGIFPEILEGCTEDLKNYQGSLGTYIMDKFSQTINKEEFKNVDINFAHQILDFYHKYENAIEASESWFVTSGNGYLQYWECDGYPLLNWKDKGYKTMFDYLTKKLPDPSKDLKLDERIQLEKVVTNIEWGTTPEGKVKVICSDQSEYPCDHVIITASLGVLKEKHHKIFTPELPIEKKNAIAGLSFGVVDKIFLEFEKPFWPKELQGISLIWTKEDSEAIRGTENAWMEDLFGFYLVDFQPNILCGWISGKSARAMELLDEATVKAGCVWLLKKFLGNKMQVTEPVKMLRTKWFSNKHSRGSYSYRSTTTDQLKTCAADLAHPLYNAMGKPIVQFAGEATHDHYYSTVHGAIESGWREAKRLNDHYNRTPDHFDVLVLGGGICGLGAAETFKKAGIRFKLLEAQERTGGRIKTVEMHNLTVDKESILVDSGAQWLHGKFNALHELAEKLNLIRPELSDEGEGDYLREDGIQFDEHFVKKIDFSVGQILEECESFALQKSHDYDFPKSLDDFLQENFKKVVSCLETDEEREKAWQLFDWHLRFQIIDNSCLHLNEVSAKNWGNYSFNGESCQTHININSGFSQLTDQLYLNMQDEILLNKVVNKIHWKDEKILVQCSDDSKYTANYVLCTFSLGVLKSNLKTMFLPKLPKPHEDAIMTIGFGIINKIFLHFDEKWWNDDWKGLQLLWKDTFTDDSHWTRYISGFDVVYPEPANTLVGWIGGKGAITMERFSDKEIVEGCVGLLRKFSKRPNIPMPSKFHTSRWHSNQFIQGAYSFTSASCDKLKDFEKILVQPIVQESNALLFAGEACHNQYFSTVHGAFLSGIEQSLKILELIQANLVKSIESIDICPKKL